MQVGIAIASLFNKKVKKMWQGERAAFAYLKENVDPEARYAWFHAASLGEFEQGRPIMEQLRREHPEYKILLTFFSPSGYEVRKNYEGADLICYMPIDTITNARRFLRTIRPELVFFIKYEFWYNYLHILKHRHVPLYSVSSIFRPGQIFFRWYGHQYGHVLKCFTRFFVQNETSRKLLSTIGINEVDVTGDTRFDRVLQIKAQAKVLPIVEAFLASHHPTTTQQPSPTTQPVFIAGSSWQPDEEVFVRYFNEHPEWKLIIAPHVIGEDHLQQIEALLKGRRVVRYTTYANEQQPSPNTSLSDADVLIIDCFGLLSSIYRYATVAYVGGGFGAGIHNLPEAAVWQVPVFFGPNNARFQEAQELKANSGGLEIDGYDDFAQLMDHLEAHPDELRQRGQAAGNYVKGRAGATERILRTVFAETAE